MTKRNLSFPSAHVTESWADFFLSRKIKQGSYASNANDALIIRGEAGTMLFPKNKLRFTTLYQGETDPEGWLILDLANMDLDGVNKVYIALADVQGAKDKGDAAMERLQQAKMLFRSIGDEEE